jgi:hypothetical protein
MKNLRERKEKVQQLKRYFDESSVSYTKAGALFKSLLHTYGSERSFFLRADDKMITNLKRVDIVFDSATQAFEKYKSISKELGKTGHDQVLTLQEIKDMKRDGSGNADFLKEDLKLWDYKHWAVQTVEVVEKEIIPLRDELVAHDIELNKLRTELQKDSVPVKNDLVLLANKLSSSVLRKYDNDPMPLALFAMKSAELEYQSDVIKNLPLRDTSDVRVKMACLKTEMAGLKKLDSLATRLSKRNFADEEKDFQHFISKAYGTASVLQNNVTATLDLAKREIAKKQISFDAVNQSMRWMISAKDSIPLFFDSNKDLKYKPVLIEEEKFTVGLFYKDTVSASGYFYSITPSRIPEIKVSFPVEPSVFKKRFYPLLKGLGTGDASGNSFVVMTYSTQKTNEKFPATIAKIYRADGLAWANNYNFEQLPTELSISAETGDISVKVLASDGSAKIITIDKTGRQK